MTATLENTGVRTSDEAYSDWTTPKTAADREAAVIELRFRHGFTPADQRRLTAEQVTTSRSGRHTLPRARGWSKRCIEKGAADIPTPLETGFPRNQPLYEALGKKFDFLGFSWRAYMLRLSDESRGSFELEVLAEVRDGCRIPVKALRRGAPIDMKADPEVQAILEDDDQWDPNSHESYRVRRWVHSWNTPTVNGKGLSLADMWIVPEEHVDEYDKAVAASNVPVGEPAGMEDAIARMSATGIGYKGIENVSWRVATESFVLPESFRRQVDDVAGSVFLLYDALRELYNAGDHAVTRLLEFRMPDRIPRLAEGRVDLVRPDIVVMEREDGSLIPVITELESCPAGQGMAYATELGHPEVTSDICEAYVRYLDGRPFRIVGTHHWAEYTFEQLAFIKGLRELGVDVELWYDRPLQQIHDMVQLGQQPFGWEPPADAPDHVKANWNTDLLGRIRKAGFDSFVKGFEELPEDIGEAVVFRFGYFDNLGPAVLSRMAKWQDRGAHVMNGLSFFTESKAMMAAAWLPKVAARMNERDPQAIHVLRRHMAVTVLLAPGSWDRTMLESERVLWMTKFAGADGDNQSWGARSLVFGMQRSNTTWPKHLDEMETLPHPVVAQHLIHSGQFHVGYVGRDGNVSLLRNARTRLTPFMIRGQGACGHLITLRANSRKVHGATDAVETRVLYRD